MSQDDSAFEPPRAEGRDPAAPPPPRMTSGTDPAAEAGLPPEYQQARYQPQPPAPRRPADWGPSKVNIPVTRGPDPRKDRNRPRGGPDEREVRRRNERLKVFASLGVGLILVIIAWKIGWFAL